MADFENELQNLQRHQRQVENMREGAEFSCSPRVACFVLHVEQ